MRIGLHIDWCISRWFGRGKNLEIKIFLPTITFGINNDYENKWYGFVFNLKTDISFESYEYGKIFSLILFGFGVKVSEFNL
jgi:hypothetical protein